MFIQALTAAAVTPACNGFGKAGSTASALSADPNKILDLPTGYSYTVISRAGSDMSDGLLTPGKADGMAAFTDLDGKIRLVCNHENVPAARSRGAFGRDLERLDLIDRTKLYDAGRGVSPGLGGTTTIIYNPATRLAERQFLSLAGTELNCAGGPTPWGSWLSCEESFGDIGPAWESNTPVHREKRHGYVFEVPAQSNSLVQPVPLKAMGRFEHEAAAVDARTGIVYLTEDKHRSLLYRFVPDTPGELIRGGKLQALAVSGKDAFDTRNWDSSNIMPIDQWFETRWIDLQDVDSLSNDLRLRGHEKGAARFARGEGICYYDGSIFVTCTIGGQHRLGQVFEYKLGAPAGENNNVERSGRLRIITEATPNSILRHADNITISPWGDMIVCEDTADHCGLVGLRADGTQYPLADNAYTESELAGICFAPDGKTMFVNIQDEGLTLAITGPW